MLSDHYSPTNWSAQEEGNMPSKKVGVEKDIHTVACVGIATQDGKMTEGILKNQHVTAGKDGDTSKQGKMTEGILKNKHVTLREDGVASKKGKMTH